MLRSGRSRRRSPVPRRGQELSRRRRLSVRPRRDRAASAARGAARASPALDPRAVPRPRRAARAFRGPRPHDHRGDRRAHQPHRHRHRRLSLGPPDRAGARRDDAPASSRRSSATARSPSRRERTRNEDRDGRFGLCRPGVGRLLRRFRPRRGLHRQGSSPRSTRSKDGVMPIYEPGLDALVEANVKAGRLSFTTDLAAGIAGAAAIFIAVGTPSRRGDGHADLSFVYAVAREIGETPRERCGRRDQVDRAGRHRRRGRADHRAKPAARTGCRSSRTPSSCAKARRSATSSAPTGSSSAPRTSSAAR